jgi:two-component system chemotaxis sensor kinase CheA
LDVDQYIDMFVEESKEHLQSINENLLKLEQSPSDLEIINEIFRSAHTLKGMAGSMGFTQMTHLTHQMENGLDLVRNHQLTVTSPLVDVLFRCADSLEAQLMSIIENNSDATVNVDDLLKQLEQVISGDTGTNAAAAGREQAGAGAWSRLDLETGLGRDGALFSVHVDIDAGSPMPAVRAYMVYEAYAGIGDIIQSRPSSEQVTNGEYHNPFEILIATTVNKDELVQAGLAISDVLAVNVEEIEELPPADARAESAATTPTAVADKPANALSGTQNSKAKDAKQASRSIRVDLERLDTLMNLFSEFVIDKTRLEQISHHRKDRELDEAVQHLSRVGSDLQDIVMKIRMVQVDTVFNRFPRMVRDLAKGLGKQVSLEISGAETELDRTLIDEIGDPLVHILRNALDHGLESPETRAKAGKDPTGHVQLVAYQSGNHVYIETRDDGGGIDRNKILEKAIERGLVERDHGAHLTDEQVFDFLFHSGFSTAQKISDISGRGVGLDVVKTKIQSLGGDVTVQSILGQGSQFIIELPLTLSIIQAMLITVADETYAIPVNAIAQMVEIKREDIQVVRDQKMIQFDERLIPLVHLRTAFSTPGQDQEKEAYSIVIMSKGKKQTAVVVDDFIGQQEVVLKSLGTYLTGHIQGVTGATILGDGRVALIIDTNWFVK